jgi:hypothetical protein
MIGKYNPPSNGKSVPATISLCLGGIAVGSNTETSIGFAVKISMATKNRSLYFSPIK